MTKTTKKQRKAKVARDRRRRAAPIAGTVVIWPAGARERYGISAPTLFRWERDGKIPKRDITVGGRKGWRPETLAAAEQIQPSA